MDISVQKYANQRTAPVANGAQRIDPGVLNDTFFSMLNQTRLIKSAEGSDGNAALSSSKINKKLSETEAFRDTGKSTVSQDRETQEISSRHAESKPKSTPKADKARSERPSGQKIPASANNASENDKTNLVEVDETTADQNIDTTESSFLAVQETETPLPENLSEEENIDVENENNASVSEDTATIVAKPKNDVGLPAAVETLPASQEIKTAVETQDIDSSETDGLPVKTAKQSADAPETEANPSLNKKAESSDGEDSFSETLTANKTTPSEEGVKTKAPKNLEAKAEASSSATPKAEALSSTASQKMTDLAPQPQKQAEAGSTRKQAEEIAKALPENTKVAVSVTIDEAPTNTVASLGKTVLTQGKSSSITPETTEESDGSMIETTKSDANVLSNSASFSAESETENTVGRNPATNQPRQERAFVGEGTISPTLNAAGTQPKTESTFANTLKSETSLSGIQAKGSIASADPQASLPLSPDAGLKAKAVQNPTAAIKSQQLPTAKANALVDQIKVNITKAVQEGLEKINITLKPKELGNIKISLEVDGEGNIKASIIASRAETLDMLQKDASLLKQALNEAGLKADDNAFSFSYRGEPQSNNEFAHQERRSSAHTNSSGTEQTNETDDMTEAVIASNWSNSRHALNIKV